MSKEAELVQKYVDAVNAKYGRNGNQFKVVSVSPLLIEDAAGNVALKTEVPADFATLRSILQAWIKA